MTDAIAALLPDDLPTRPRALAVLDGLLAGQVWTDDPVDPSWAAVMEGADGTLFTGGRLTLDRVRRVFEEARSASGDLVIGFRSSEDRLRDLLPPDPYYRGEAIDFTARESPADEEMRLDVPLPGGLELVELTPALLPRTEWYEDTVAAFGSAERLAELSVGVCVVRGEDEVVSQGMAGPRVRGLTEMGVWTREDHRRQGLGTLVSHHAAVRCEAAADVPWWNTNAENEASIAIARAIGFRRERRYELVAYRIDAS